MGRAQRGAGQRGGGRGRRRGGRGAAAARGRRGEGQEGGSAFESIADCRSVYEMSQPESRMLRPWLRPCAPQPTMTIFFPAIAATPFANSDRCMKRHLQRSAARRGEVGGGSGPEGGAESGGGGGEATSRGHGVGSCGPAGEQGCEQGGVWRGQRRLASWLSFCAWVSVLK